jgi:hypothetical protein
MPSAGPGSAIQVSEQVLEVDHAELVRPHATLSPPIAISRPNPWAWITARRTTRLKAVVSLDL